ncbi:circadian clock-controlled protein daywake-like [Musca autumnalis]|uniref:circadian clock-controlled protein daywake-like n=1 Tax=Musca autumnalis TaxID=221902 RepID=UPI003CF904A1
MKGFNLCYFLFTISWGFFLQPSSAFEWSFLKACTAEDELCQRENVVSFFKTYSNGVPELDIPQLEPLSLGKFNIKHQGNPNFNLNMFIKDVQLVNHTKIECLAVKGFKKDVTKPTHITMLIRHPYLTLQAHCHLKGKLLIFNAEGDADLEIRMINTTSAIDVDLEPYTKDNRSYFNATSYYAKQQTSSAKIVFKNSSLFNGDQQFAEIFTDAINENWSLMRDEIQPHFEKVNAKVALITLNKILRTIPSDQFFKDQ